MRQQINQLDDELLQVLSTRMKVAQKIGEYKKNNDITILQTNRWNEILERAVAKGNVLGLSDDFITKYMDAVHMESIQQQNKITKRPRTSNIAQQNNGCRYNHNDFIFLSKYSNTGIVWIMRLHKINSKNGIDNISNK